MRRLIPVIVLYFFLKSASSAFGEEEQRQQINWRDFAVAKSEKVLPHKKMTSKVFLEHFEGGKNFVRALKKGDTLQKGLNKFEDILDFTTLKNIHRDYIHGANVGVFTVPEGATIEPYKDKFKANKLLLVGVISLAQVKRYKLENLNICTREKLEEAAKQLEPEADPHSEDFHLQVDTADYIFWHSVMYIARYAAWASSWHAIMQSNSDSNKAMLAIKLVQKFAEESVAGHAANEAAEFCALEVWPTAIINNSAIEAIAKLSKKSPENSSTRNLFQAALENAAAPNDWKNADAKDYDSIVSESRSAIEAIAETAAKNAAHSAMKKEVQWELVGCDAYLAAEKALIEHVIDKELWRELLIAAKRAILQGGAFDKVRGKITAEERNNPFISPIIFELKRGENGVTN